MQDWTFSLQRLLNTPLACTEAHAAMIVAAVHARFGIDALRIGDDELGSPELSALAQGGQAAAVDRRGYRRDKLFHENSGAALIPIHGTLVKRTSSLDPSSGMTGYDRVEQKLIAAAKDPEVRGIWMSFDSGGGEAAGMHDLMDLIWSINFKNGGDKPIYAIADDHAYSAAFGLMSAADKSFVTRLGGAGSVGVLALIANRSGQQEKQGIKVKVMRSGAQKARVNSLEEMDQETEAAFQAELDQAREIFAEGVARNLKLSKKKVLETEGASYMGDQARAIGFVNEVASAQQAWVQFQRKINR